MHSNHYDIVIIGGGLGGLLSACFLSMEGKSVCVIDRNKQIGGNLQTFVRNREIFDTGVHYVGGLSKGQNLHQIFKYVGILDDLKFQKMDNIFDQISFEGNQTVYKMAQGYDAFTHQLVEQFPEEEVVINTFVEAIQQAVKNFPLYHLDAETEYSFFNDSLSIGAKDYIDSLTDNEQLKAVLSGNNMLFAGNGKATPFYVMALTLNTYIESAYKFINGGSQIAKALVKKIRTHGGDVKRHLAVTHIHCEGKNATHVELSNGETISGDYFISNVHPNSTLNLLDTSTIRKPYLKRMRGLKDTIGVFSVYLVLKSNVVPYMNYNIYHHKELDLWDTSTDYDESKWPSSYMVSSSATPCSLETKYASCLTIMTYMKHEELAQWDQSFNTVLKEEKRGELYEAFKKRKAALVIDEVAKKLPKLKEAIEHIYTSSPLSYRDYIGSPTGSAYGIERDYNAPWKTMVNPKSKIPNLYFTGQNIILHGVLGVSIGAIVTCGELIGKPYLVKKINKA